MVLQSEPLIKRALLPTKDTLFGPLSNNNDYYYNNIAFLVSEKRATSLQS